MLMRSALFAVGLLSAAPALAKKEDIPNTKIGKLATELLKLCESPSLEKLTPWLAAHLSPESQKEISAKDFAQAIRKECRSHGGYQFVSVSLSEPGKLVLAVQGNQTQIETEFSLELDQKGKVSALDVNAMIPPESKWAKNLTDAAVKREIEKDVERLGRQGLFSGVVLVARGTQNLAMATAGHADRSRKTPMTGSTRFTLASMSKLFTAVAVGQLVDQKKLSFDDKVGKFLPDFPNQLVRDQVTVGMLLSHFSGMGYFLDKRTPGMLKNGVKRAEEFLPLLAQEELLYPPGTMQGYSNSGYVLAGAIVEKVSGLDYPDYIRKHIFEAAGMRNSDPNHIPHKHPQLVIPYEYSDRDVWQVAEADLGSPAGGAISTAEDLVLFADALRSGKLVSKETLEQMKIPRSKDGRKYGYGLFIREIYGQTQVGHAGGASGVSTLLTLMLDTPYTLIVLQNMDLPVEIFWKWMGLVAAKAKTSP